MKLSDGWTGFTVWRSAVVAALVRTYPSRRAELTERLGAASRFQAGANAVRKGWL